MEPSEVFAEKAASAAPIDGALELEARLGVVERLRRRQAASPGDVGLAHDLGTLCFWLARRLSDPRQATETWRRVVANWATILESPAGWSRWIGNRETVYAEPVGEEHRERARREIAERLLRALAGHDHRCPPPSGEVPLELAYHLEAAAARVLGSSGGLPVDGPGGSLACGPLLARDLELTDRIAHLVGELPEPAEAGGAVPPWAWARDGGAAGSRRRLMLCFSELGPGLIQLEREEPEAALASLSAVRCAECGSRGGEMARGAGRLPPARFCAAGCSRFAERNPAYAGLPDGSARLARDAMELLSWIAMAAADRRVRRDPPDVEGSLEDLRDALETAPSADARARLERAVAQMAIGRAIALDQRQQWDPAIALLEAVSDRIADERIAGKLAELLTDRGVRAGNDQRWTDAAGDLRRALGLNAHLDRSRRNLVIALRGEAARLFRSGEPERARGPLAEAIEVLEAGLAMSGGSEEWQRTLLEVRIEHAAAGGGALPSVRPPVSAFLAALAAAGRPSADADPSPAAAAVTACVARTKLKYQHLGRGPYLFPFHSEHHRQVLVLVHADEDRAVVSAPVPPFPGAEATLLRSLLRATHEADIFKLCRSRAGALSLVAEVPIHLLNPVVLEGLVRQAALLTDTAEETLGQPGEAVLHFRVTQALVAFQHLSSAPRRLRRLLSWFGRGRPARRLPRLCRRARVRYRRDGRDGFLLTFGPMDLKVGVFFRGEGVSFGAAMGGLRPSAGNLGFYRRMAEINHEMKVCKLALDSDHDTAFLYELPALDEPGFRQMRERVESYAMRYSLELAALV